MKSQELKSHNLPQDRIVENVIDAKPYELIIAVTIIGVFLIWFDFLAYGGSLALVGVLFLFFLPRRIIIEFSHDYMVVYNRADSRECKMIYYEDVVYWNYNRAIHTDTLNIEFVDGTTERIEAFSKNLFEKYLNIYMKDKKFKKI